MGHRLGGLSKRLPAPDAGDDAAPTDASLHLPTLFRISLLMISVASDEKATASAHSKQVKVVRKTGLSLLLHLFSAPGIDLEAFWAVEERVALVKRVVLTPYLAQMGISAVASPGHLVLKLAQVWSQSGSPPLVESFFCHEVLSPMVELLKHPKLMRGVAKILIEVVANLVFSQGMFVNRGLT